MTARGAVIALILVLSLGGAAGNLVLLRAQEGELADPHRALVRNPSERPVELVINHGRNVGSRFLVYTWLGDQIPGSTVVLTPGHPLVTEALLGLGRASVRYGEHDGRLDPSVARALEDDATVMDWFNRYRFAPDSSLIETGVPAAFSRGDFAVVLAEATGTPTLRVYWFEDTVYLVDEDLLDTYGLTTGPS